MIKTPGRCPGCNRPSPQEQCLVSQTRYERCVDTPQASDRYPGDSIQDDGSEHAEQIYFATLT